MLGFAAGRDEAVKPGAHREQSTGVDVVRALDHAAVGEEICCEEARRLHGFDDAVWLLQEVGETVHGALRQRRLVGLHALVAGEMASP